METSEKNPNSHDDNKLLRTLFVKKVTSDNKVCQYWTGVSSLSLLNYIFEWVLPCAEKSLLWMGQKRHERRKHEQSSRRRLLTHWEKFLIMIIRNLSLDMNAWLT